MSGIDQESIDDIHAASVKASFALKEKRTTFDSFYNKEKPVRKAGQDPYKLNIELFNAKEAVRVVTDRIRKLFTSVSGGLLAKCDEHDVRAVEKFGVKYLVHDEVWHKILTGKDLIIAVDAVEKKIKAQIPDNVVSKLLIGN